MAAAKTCMTMALRRFKRARKGSAAIEFALVVFPFFLFLFGLAEIAMIGFAQTSLNYAVAETAREIRTGQAQTGGLSASDIRQQVCDELNDFMMMECDGNLFLDVNRFDSFTNASNDADTPIQGGAFIDSGFGYTPGAASDVVVVRAYYRWAVMTPMFEAIFANVSDGQRILVSTMMFRNEPF
ncbi:MAG: pilus assembly protein [Phycisphaerales bacterium]|nr:pilus assembly protein [Hyphomonadaceae bacterium]